jgi:serpin B
VGDAISSQRQRVTWPDVTASDVAGLVTGCSAFAFDLYHVLRETAANLFFSPYSISVALAMAYAGARGETQEQMAAALHFLLGQDRLHPTLNRLDLELARRCGGAQGDDEKGFRLSVANALWAQEGYAFLPSFLDLLAENYGAGLRWLDFMGAPEEPRATINAWVRDQTEGRIENLVPEGVIDALTRLVLTNAIYFRGAWAKPFEAHLTGDGAFYLNAEGEVTVPMMTQTESFAYAAGQGYQVVELPYDGRAFSMVILLPEAGKLDALESTFDVTRLAAIVRDMAHRRVALTMPRLEFESGFSLAGTLAEMGMPLAFSQDADFSGMTRGRDLLISDVIHRAYVSVDELGTEAAAATATIMVPTMAMPEPAVEFKVDRPFVFFIRDIKTGIVLFLGRVADPRT